MRESSDSKFIPMTSISSGKGVEVVDDLFYYTNQIVNVVMIGRPGDNNWVLVDTGMPKRAGEIRKVAEDRFGVQPLAILLTHGHFDHVGGLIDLLEHWNCPVYAHKLEFPYLTGRNAYPEPDPTVEGGMLAKIASYYPKEPIDVTERLQALPEDGSVPFLYDWQWVHVPGHCAGQVAFYREKDGTLLSADALVTVRQDSFYNVLLQTPEVNGPPRYYTTDWVQARASVGKLADLKPKRVISGHGPMMIGAELEQGLDLLIREFESRALPEHGIYVEQNNVKR